MAASRRSGARPFATRRAQAIAAACVLALAAALGSSTVARATDLLVPAYFAAEGTPNPWHTMCDPAAAGSTAIVNPRNGPVKRQAPAYLSAMSYCRERGWRTIGYVFTRYGKRSLKTVEKAIDHYYLWYPGIEGIFLDEMAEAPSPKIDGYYEALAAHVHERGGYLVGNPGDTAATGWQLSYVDQVVTFEGTDSDFASYLPPAWVTQARPEQIANIVFAAGSSTRMQSDCTQAAGHNTGSVYVTNLAERPNPYASLPSYWPSELTDC